MKKLPALALLPLAAAAAAAGRSDEGLAQQGAIREDVSVQAPAAGPALALPQPGPDRAVVDEVVGSLRVLSEDHRARVADVRVPAAERLSRPFPEAPYIVFSPRLVTAPYDVWTFQVLDSQGRELLSQQGTGRVVEPIEWDGSGPSGDDAVRTGESYWFRFTGQRGPASFVVASEPARLASLTLRGLLGGERLEAQTSLLFDEGRAQLKKGAAVYLTALADRMARVAPKDGYTLELRQRSPGSELAKARAKALQTWLAEKLLVNAALVRVARLEPGTRGEVLACALPAEKGDVIGRP